VAPIAAGSWATTFTGGFSLSARANSSKPTSVTGLTAAPPWMASMAPIVTRSLLVNRAVGGYGCRSGATAASAASARPRRPCLASSGTRQNMTQPSVSKYVYVSSCSSLG